MKNKPTKDKTIVIIDGKPMPGRPTRNVPCHCGSGLKYKKCHFLKDFQANEEKIRLEREETAKKEADKALAAMMPPLEVAGPQG